MTRLSGETVGCYFALGSASDARVANDNGKPQTDERSLLIRQLQINPLESLKLR
jgi:hypothetical protein